MRGGHKAFIPTFSCVSVDETRFGFITDEDKKRACRRTNERSSLASGDEIRSGRPFANETRGGERSYHHRDINFRGFSLFAVDRLGISR